MLFTVPRLCFSLSMVGRLLATFLFLGLTAASAEAPKLRQKPTELVVARYEKLIATGALLTPEGWARASKLFDQQIPYPKDGEILVESTGGLLAEDWVNGDRAQVETKWNDYYGKIDANLKYTPPTPNGGAAMPAAEMFSLRKELSGNQVSRTERATGWEWRIEGPLQVRRATVAFAIKYVADMCDKSHDPVVRRNANNTIAALKRVSRGCGNASAC